MSQVVQSLSSPDLGEAGKLIMGEPLPPLCVATSTHSVESYNS